MEAEQQQLHAEAAAAPRDQRQQSGGLEEAVIKTITVCKYEKGDGLIEGTECAVCLSEFEENEALRLLPKCSHAFHLPCIDTWLKSHSSCPLCRAIIITNTTSSSAPLNVDSYEFQRPRDLVIVVDDRELHCLVGEGGVRRLVSLPSQRHRFVSDDVEMDEVEGGRAVGPSNQMGLQMKRGRGRERVIVVEEERLS